MPSIEHASVFGVRINTESKDAIYANISQYTSGDAHVQPLVIYTPNPEILLHARKHTKYRSLLNASSFNLPDGTGLLYLNSQIKERITGADTVRHILDIAQQQSLSVGIVYNERGLSSEKDIIQSFAKQYPAIRVYTIGSTSDASSFPNNPDIVLTATGFPAQEQWIHQHRAELPHARLFMAVGGSIDFITGKQQRAPLFLRKIGLEWLWRLFRQPNRIGRIITAVVLFPLIYIFDSLSTSKQS